MLTFMGYGKPLSFFPTHIWHKNHEIVKLPEAGGARGGMGSAEKNSNDFLLLCPCRTS